MKLRDHYDWIVLGDHPGALLSAGLAARLGLSVLVLSAFPARGPGLSQDGLLLDPETNYLLGLGRSERSNGLLAECLARLGILPAESEQIVASQSLPQILTQEMRLTLGPADARMTHELQRELGPERAARSGMDSALRQAESEYLGYWLQLPERLTLAPGKDRAKPAPLKLGDIRKKVAKEVSASHEQQWLTTGRRASELARQLGRPEFQEALSSFWFGATGTVADDPTLSSLLHMAAVARTGASFRGGMTAYRELLLRLARRLGAHVPPKTECRRVFVDKGSFAGVQIANRASMITGGGGVVGCGLSQIATLVTHGGSSWFKKLKASPTPVGWRFTLAFAVRADAVPPGSSSRMIWKEPGAPVLEIEVADPAELGPARPGQRVIFARTVLPYSEETLSADYQRMISARLLRQLVEIFPFLEENLVEVYPEFRPAEGMARLTEAYAFEALDRIPENLRCLPLHDGVGVGSHSGIEGLFVASGESFPELGSLGGTVAALESVSWLAHRAGLAGPFA